jgi:DNA-binding HxlR family transcriptional regulator
VTVRTYGQYCPIARAAEVLGDRWTVLIVREMSFGVSRFNELERCLPGISRSVLAQRLRHLVHVGLVDRQDGGYVLTPAGTALKPVLRALGDWAATWAFGEPDPRTLDPDLVIRWISRHVASSKLPGRRVVACFELTAPRPRRYWLVLQPEEASVCLTEPAFGTDVLVTTTTATLYDVYLGRLDLRSAVRDELVRLDGRPSLVRSFPSWFTWSDFAPAVRTGELARS